MNKITYTVNIQSSKNLGVGIEVIHLSTCIFLEVRTVTKVCVYIIYLISGFGGQERARERIKENQ